MELDWKGILLIILVSIIAIGFITWAIVAKAMEDGPKDVVEKWLDAWARGDAETYAKYVVSSQKSMLDFSKVKADDFIASIKVGEEYIINTNSAYVTIYFTDNTYASVWLVREQGNWKIDTLRTLVEL